MKQIRVIPYSDGGIGNEHFITAKGPGFDEPSQDSFEDMNIETESDLLEIFPDGASRGTRIELRRQPTDDELTRLRSYAVEKDAEIEITIKTDEQYREMRNKIR